MIEQTLLKSCYQENDFVLMDEAKSFTELEQIAEQVVIRMRNYYGGVGICCGPMMTGGVGKSSANFHIFKEVIIYLQAGYPIFNQLPFEDHFRRLFLSFESNQLAYDSLFKDFYFPLFHQINFYYFLPRWQSSIGAGLEHDDIKTHNSDGIIYLDENIQFVNFFQKLEEAVCKKFNLKF